MKVRVYTMWASLKGTGEASPWMIAAEDEFSWEGDPDRCERVFQTARDLADRNEWDYREVTLHVDFHAVAKCFMPNDVEVEVE
jgi:hypothetical protein